MFKKESFCKHFRFHVLGSFGLQVRYVDSEAPRLLFPRMAGAFEKAMVAGQKFLEGLRSLPSYKDAQQKQLRALLKQLGLVTDLTTGQSGKILSMLDEKLWDHESLQQLRQQIADKTEQIAAADSRIHDIYIYIDYKYRYMCFDELFEVDRARGSFGHAPPR